MLYGHKGAVLWFTGLSGSGKSTLTVEVEKALYQKGIGSYILDGDNIRYGLNTDLGFSLEDRKENIRRIGEVTRLFIDANVMVLTAFISPYHKDRDLVRHSLGQDEFIEVFVKCSLEACEKRDPKGLYKKVRKGFIKDFTGIDSPYEEPRSPEIVVETERVSLEECVDIIVKYLEKNNYI